MGINWIAKHNTIIAFILGMAVCLAASVGVSSVRADFDECSDDLYRYQAEVEKCILESKDLEDAKGCWEF